MTHIQPITEAQKSDIRRLSIDYLHELAEHLNRHIDTPFGPENIKALVDNDMEHFDRFMPPSGHYLVAVDGDQVVGMGGLKRLTDDISEIKRMYIVPSHRGQGLGRTMVQTLIDQARSVDYRLVRLDVFKFWTAAPPLYRSFGFVEIDVYEGAEPPEELHHLSIFMELSLD